MRVGLVWAAAYEFACHSAACRPSTSGGTGGSVSGGHTIEASSSPLYQRRTGAEAAHMSEADAHVLVRSKDATGASILDQGNVIHDGQTIGVRANLNVKARTADRAAGFGGITVQTMHRGTDPQRAKGGVIVGKALSYGAEVTIRNVTFGVSQSARDKIATKKANKFPMASANGHFVAHPPANRYDGIEVRFNPFTSHLFVDNNGRAVRSAQEATAVGSQVFVRGKVTYWDEKNMPTPHGGVPTIAHTRS